MDVPSRHPLCVWNSTDTVRGMKQMMLCIINFCLAKAINLGILCGEFGIAAAINIDSITSGNV